MKRRILYIGAAAGIAAAAGIIAWSLWFTAGDSPEVALRTLTVERGDITRVVSATGHLSARADVELRGGKSGTIEEILVKEGDHVREGQVLARFEDDQEELNFLQAEHALEEAEVALESARVSRASRQEIRTKERELAECRLQLALRKDALNDTVVTAPFAGIVSKVYVEEYELVLGETLSTSEPIARLVDTNRLFLDVNVDEVDIAEVASGQTARITFDAYPDEIFAGRVTNVSPEATESSGLVVVEVTIELNDADPRLKPGFTGNADIVVAHAENVITVPVEEVVERGPVSLVMVLQDGESVQREVETGIFNESRIQITRGLKEGDELVLSGLAGLVARRNQAQATERQGGFRGPMMK